MFVCSNVAANRFVIYNLHLIKRFHVVRFYSLNFFFVFISTARTYVTVSDIMRHGFRVHSGIKMLCSYKCGFSSAYTGALKEHEDRAHKNMYKVRCTYVQQLFQAVFMFWPLRNINISLEFF